MRIDHDADCLPLSIAENCVHIMSTGGEYNPSADTREPTRTPPGCPQVSCCPLRDGVEGKAASTKYVNLLNLSNEGVLTFFSMTEIFSVYGKTNNSMRVFTLIQENKTLL